MALLGPATVTATRIADASDARDVGRILAESADDPVLTWVLHEPDHDRKPVSFFVILGRDAGDFGARRERVLAAVPSIMALAGVLVGVVRSREGPERRTRHDRRDR